MASRDTVGEQSCDSCGRSIARAVLLAAFGVVFGGLPACASDGARQVSKSNLNPENFLDLQAYSFSKREDDLWYEADNGWRSGGGSLGLDLLYLLLEVKLRHPLSESWSVGFELEQEEFYEIKPLNYLVEVEWRPQAWLGVAFVGMPEYDKRHADEGLGIMLGHQPWDFLRYRRVLHDLYYNEKNFYDNSTYDAHPIEDVWEGALRWGKWRLRGKRAEVRPFTQRFPAEQLTFKSSSVETALVLDWQPSPERLLGVTAKSFDAHKWREAPNTTARVDNRRQHLRYESLNLYGLQPLNPDWHGSFGLRWDRFCNEFRDLVDGRDSEDFSLKSLQLYSELRQTTSPTTAWEYGLYAADVVKTSASVPAATTDKPDKKLEIKLRVSWQVGKVDEQGALRLISTWDVDSFSPSSFLGIWDGGSMTYQHTF